MLDTKEQEFRHVSTREGSGVETWKKKKKIFSSTEFIFLTWIYVYILFMNDVDDTWK